MDLQVISELQKLYPKVKIPVDKHAEYYINTLKKDPNYSWLDEAIINLNDLKDKEGDIKKYKFALMDKILVEWKEKKYIDILNSTEKEISNNGYQKREFGDWSDFNLTSKTNTIKFYISIDLKEANWSVFQRYTKITDTLISWENYITTNFNAHPAIAKSKSFRQFVLGNTNPKRLAKLQEQKMQIIFNSFDGKLKNGSIVSKTSDEMIIEFTVYNDHYAICQAIKDSYEVAVNLSKEILIRITPFTVNAINSYGEHVRIKSSFDYKINYGFHPEFELKSGELMGVPGNRFFLHYKKLILDQPLEPYDLMFENDKNIAQWII